MRSAHAAWTKGFLMAGERALLPQTNPACRKYPRQAAFVNANLPDATQIANQLNTAPGDILGLAGFESNWGGGQLITAGTNNYFSLKAGPAFATGATGTYQYGPNTFWTYPGPGMLASGNAFAQSYFGTRVNGITDPQAFAAALNAGGKYNSDPNYNSTLVSTINQANAVMGCP
ncbi:MAG TPA: glucosaminidase domain-containing protein [Steroidobacteraceae bacterium]|nr:glucosaminidase domain-containing protein [Steroidobacteraceae bacterium]